MGTQWIINAGQKRFGSTGSAPLRALFILVLSLAIGGCGFQLRGAVEIPDSLKRVYFTAKTESAAAKAVKRLLKSNGVQLVGNPDAAPYQLQILSESSERRAATLNSQAKTEEYELRLTLQFQVLGPDGKPVLKPEVLITEQVYTFDENNVNAKDAEEALLRNEMKDNLARQLVRRYLGLAARQQ